MHIPSTLAFVISALVSLTAASTVVPALGTTNCLSSASNADNAIAEIEPCNGGTGRHTPRYFLAHVDLILSHRPTVDLLGRNAHRVWEQMLDCSWRLYGQWCQAHSFDVLLRKCESAMDIYRHRNPVDW
jgi:hypothetical protein